jgi:hypothetical protein
MTDENGSAAKAMAGSYVSGTMLHDINDVSMFTEANKWGDMTQRVKWIIDTAVKGVFLTMVGVVEAVIWLALKSYVIFIFFFYGILLLIARDLILWLCPPLAKYSKLLTDIIDAIIWFLNVGFNALFDGTMYSSGPLSCRFPPSRVLLRFASSPGSTNNTRPSMGPGVNIMMSFVNKDIIGLINDVAKVLGLHKLDAVHFGGLRWKNIPKVDPDQVHAWLTGLPPTCQRFDGMAKIVLWLLQYVDLPSIHPSIHLTAASFFPGLWRRATSARWCGTCTPWNRRTTPASSKNCWGGCTRGRPTRSCSTITPTVFPPTTRHTRRPHSRSRACAWGYRTFFSSSFSR